MSTPPSQRQDTFTPHSHLNRFVSGVELVMSRVTSGIWRCLKHGLRAWLRFRLKLLPNHRKFACVIRVFGAEKEKDITENSRQSRLRLITLYSQIRVEIQTHTYNPNTYLGWNIGCWIQVVGTCPGKGKRVLTTAVRILYMFGLVMLWHSVYE